MIDECNFNNLFFSDSISNPSPVENFDEYIRMFFQLNDHRKIYKFYMMNSISQFLLTIDSNCFIETNYKPTYNTNVMGIQMGRNVIHTISIGQLKKLFSYIDDNSELIESLIDLDAL